MGLVTGSPPYNAMSHSGQSPAPILRISAGVCVSVSSRAPAFASFALPWGFCQITVRWAVSHPTVERRKTTDMGAIHHLERRQVIPIPLQEAWDYFATPRNLEEMTPASLSFQIQWGGEEPMHPGQLIGYRVKVAPGTYVNWLTEITVVEPGVAFVDEQRRGPYRLWHHLHRFMSVPGGTQCLDRVRYELPFGPLGAALHALWIKRQLMHIFDFRTDHLVRRFGPAPAPVLVKD